MLLTGDKTLRNCATPFIEVHGSIWIFDKLVMDGILAPKKAANKLKLLASQIMRLPADEIEKRLQNWQ
jgi:hypothetical protein